MLLRGPFWQWGIEPDVPRKRFALERIIGKLGGRKFADGSLADITARSRHVRSSPDNDQLADISARAAADWHLHPVPLYFARQRRGQIPRGS
jgi:hypothetical protein